MYHLNELVEIYYGGSKSTLIGKITGLVPNGTSYKYIISVLDTKLLPVGQLILDESALALAPQSSFNRELKILLKS